MSSHQIHVFISHSWKYSNHYEKLSEWIFSEKWNVNGVPLNFHDYSIPQNDPIHNANTDKELQDVIYNRIARSHVIVIPTGMYASYSKWIKKEIEGASGHRKPILAVDPWGQQRSSDIVISNAHKFVGWNSKSVVGGVWDLFRG